MSERCVERTLPEWAASLLAARRRRLVLRQRGVVLGLLALTLGATILAPPPPVLVWNASASVPIGLYAVALGRVPGPRDLVAVRLPGPWRRLAAQRRYLPATAVLVKRVAGVAGDTVCSNGKAVLLNGRVVVVRRRFDGAGRPLSWWQGCRVLREGELFLLTADPASFDGRYFGVITHEGVIGRAVPLWTR